MNKQLREAIDILDKQGITYWLDSGTLLALMRDGQLLEHDEDIDISIWSQDVPKLRQAVPLFRKAGYRIFTASYNRELFKYKLTPPDLQNERIIDINIYRESRGFAWSPMYYFNYSPSKEKTQENNHSFSRVVRKGIRTCWKHFNTKFAVHVGIDAMPWRAFLNICTWWVPGRHFDTIVFNPSLNAYIPGNWEAYLDFRYGNWMEPQTDWVFYRDDNGIQNTRPENLLCNWE